MIGVAPVSMKSSAMFLARSEFVKALLGSLLHPSHRRNVPPAVLMCRIAHLYYSELDPSVLACV